MSNPYELLVAFDPNAVREASSTWRGLAHAVEDAGGRHRTKVNGPLRHSWQGRDAEAAFLAMERTEQELDIVKVEAEAAALTLDTVADRMQQAQTNLLNAVHRAGEWGLRVSADGSVGLPPADPAEQHDPDAAGPRRELAGRAGELQERINAALRAAREASDQGRSALAQLDADILTGPRPFGATAETATDTAAVLKGLGLVDPSIPDGKDPGRSADWWKSSPPTSSAATSPCTRRRSAGWTACPPPSATRPTAWCSTSDSTPFSRATPGTSGSPTTRTTNARPR